MSHVTRKEWYRRVNTAWPAAVPPLTAEEATRAVRRLYRYVKRRTWWGTVRVTSGRRRTRILYGGINPATGTKRAAIVVNPAFGWQEMVHALSHWLHSGPHGGEHARLELRMIKQVIGRGWLDGKLKTPPKTWLATPDNIGCAAAARQRMKIERLEARLSAWRTKHKRATTAIRKLEKALKRRRPTTT